MNEPTSHALLGGCLIGLAAIILLLADGKIAGVSGILGGVFRHKISASGWRYAFLGGLLLGGAAVRLLSVAEFAPLANRSTGAIVAAGLLVGFGTQIGSGCTSGHGVCGIGRFSLRSLLATLTFMVAGALTVYFVGHLWGAV